MSAKDTWGTCPGCNEDDMELLATGRVLCTNLCCRFYAEDHHEAADKGCENWEPGETERTKRRALTGSPFHPHHVVHFAQRECGTEPIPSLFSSPNWQHVTCWHCLQDAPSPVTPAPADPTFPADDAGAIEYLMHKPRAGLWNMVFGGAGIRVLFVTAEQFVEIAYHHAHKRYGREELQEAVAVHHLHQLFLRNEKPDYRLLVQIRPPGLPPQWTLPITTGPRKGWDKVSMDTPPDGEGLISIEPRVLETRQETLSQVHRKLYGPEWIGFTLGYDRWAAPRHPRFPWWQRSADGISWFRTDKLRVCVDGDPTSVEARWWWAPTTAAEELVFEEALRWSRVNGRRPAIPLPDPAFVGSSDAVLAEVDRLRPLEQPPMLAGQVWASEDGSLTRLIADPGIYLKVWESGGAHHAATVRPQRPVGECLVAGPGSPWAPPLPRSSHEGLPPTRTDPGHDQSSSP